MKQALLAATLASLIAPAAHAAPGERCWVSNHRETCIATSGSDRFGYPKLIGQLYWTTSDGRVFYAEPHEILLVGDGEPSVRWRSIPHKGQPHRYVGYRYTVRYYQPPTSGSSTTIGNGTTNCTSDYFGGVNCTHTPPTTLNIPGTAGGVRTVSRLLVHDCKDATTAYYKSEKKTSGKWDKEGKPYGVCKIANKLEPYHFKL